MHNHHDTLMLLYQKYIYRNSVQILLKFFFLNVSKSILPESGNWQVFVKMLGYLLVD